MKLEGVMKGQEYYPVRGIHNGMPYRIVQERGRFLLEAVSIGIGIGMQSGPVGFFGDDWRGVFSYTANAAHDARRSAICMEESNEMETNQNGTERRNQNCCVLGKIGHCEDVTLHYFDDGERWYHVLFDGERLKDEPTHWIPIPTAMLTARNARTDEHGTRHQGASQPCRCVSG